MRCSAGSSAGRRASRAPRRRCPARSGHLPGTAEGAADLLGELRRQRRAVSTLFRDTGRTFAAIGSNRQQVDALIRNARDLFDATATSESDLRATFRALPGFLDGLRASSLAVQRAAVPTTPLLRELRPVARTLPRTLEATNKIAPVLQSLAAPLDRVTRRASTGLNAARQIVRASGPLFRQLDPLSQYLIPIVDFAWAYRREIVTQFPKTAAATQPSYLDPASGAAGALPARARRHRQRVAHRPQGRARPTAATTPTWRPAGSTSSSRAR